MPGADDDTGIKIHERLARLDPVSSLLCSGNTIEDILEIIFDGCNLEVLAKTTARYFCDCGRNKMEKALIGIGRDGLSEMIENDKKAELVCHFCNKNYSFDENQLRILLKCAI